MQTLTVDLGDRSYPIHIGPGLLSQPDLIVPHLLQKRVMVVTNTTVAPLYLAQLTATLESAGVKVATVVLPDGEAYKNWETLNLIFDALLTDRAERKTTLIALGGGVIGDMTGFAAACYQRGVPFVQIPTTLLAQVDSSVGGKTGVNTRHGKNLVGAFHQPNAVIADVATLDSLPEREFNEGFAEIIKHAAIRDASLLDLVEAKSSIREHLVELVARNVAIKAAVVEEDERETTGTRALLNFGHTIGHGIEAAGGYGRFLHGEAISLGLVAATRLSVEKSGLDPAAGERLLAALKTYGLPTTLAADVPDDAILSAMGRDKKFEAGQIRFVLLKSLGEAFVSDAVENADLMEALENLRV
jgi:3-dehydroquinate synthase